MAGYNYVLEQYCDANNIMQQETSICYVGCYDGACINESLPCTDSDGGENHYTKGITSKGPLNFTDDCRIENYCAENGTVQQDWIFGCRASSTQCTIEGACIIDDAT